MTTIDNSLLVRNAPESLQIETTSKCNLKCKMCSLTTGDTLSSHNPDHMSDEIWGKIVPIAKLCNGVNLTGYGEPLLNKNFLSFLKELNHEKIHFGMSTNGTLLNESIANELASLDYLSHINFSIDSPEVKGYRSIRGGLVNKALTGLKNFMAVTRFPERVTVSSVLLQENIKDLANFPQILAELGAKRFFLQGLIDQNVLCSEYQLLHEPDLFEFLDEIHHKCNEYDIEITTSLAERLELERNFPNQALLYFSDDAFAEGETKKCGVPWEIPFIDREGRVFPCCHGSRDKLFIMGHLQQESWDEIWNGKRFRDFRLSLLMGGSIVPRICQSCNAASRGSHPLAYAVEILPHKSCLKGKHIKLIAKNIGPYTWTQADPIRVGTAAPRDRESQLSHSSWISGTRPASFKEKHVPSGGLATFEFQVESQNCPDEELFELVYEGETWIQNTQFAVKVSPWWRRTAMKISSLIR